MDHNIKLYFDSRPQVNVFYFTTDGQAFFTQPAASAHGQNLEKKKKGDGAIDCVTRVQVNEWWAIEVPKLVQAAEAAVIAAEKEEEDAHGIVTNIPKEATPSKKMAANKRLETATKALQRAKDKLEAANNALVLLNDGKALQEAKDKLDEDLHADNVDAATIEADKNAVAEAAGKVEGDKKKKK